MADSTMDDFTVHELGSAFGTLSLGRYIYLRDEVAPYLPRLCFDSGDLLIKLGHDKRDWLLVHGAFLAAASPVIRTGLSTPWRQSAHLDRVHHPRCRREVEYKTLALRQVDGTLVLENKDVLLKDHVIVDAFESSELAPPGWPATFFGLQAVEHTQRSLRILFALLYDAELTWYHVATSYEQTDTLEALRYLITAGAYAEYLQCLDHITAAVTAIVRSDDSFAQLIPNALLPCLLFTKKFSLYEEFYDCTRHIVAQAFYNEGLVTGPFSWNRAADWLDVNSADLRAFYRPQFLYQQAKRSRLKSALYSLQIESIERKEIRNDNSQHALFSWIVNKVQNWWGERKAEEKAHFLARAIWGQWLAAHDGSAFAVKQGFDPEASRFRNFSSALEEIEAAADTDPLSLFGEETPAVFGQTFHLSQRSESVERIKEKLRDIVLEAKRRIEKEFKDKVLKAPNDPDPLYCGYHVETETRRARCDVFGTGYGSAGVEYCTYLSVPREDVEMEVEPEWVEKPESLDLDDVSKRFMEALR